MVRGGERQVDEEMSGAVMDMSGEALQCTG